MNATTSRRRLRTIVPVLVCVIAIGVLLVAGLTHNAVYFRTVSEATASRQADGANRLRIAGAVVPGSVETLDGTVVFALTDGLDTIEVRHRGDPPELFADGAPVITEGRWADVEFSSDRLMIKHGSVYEAPAIDDMTPAGSDGNQRGSTR